MTDARELLSVAVDCASRAGVLLLDRFGGTATGVGTKSSTADLVSDADRDAERLIVEAIRAARPGDAILAEEGGGGAGERLRWIVDPLDGTVNYLFGIPHWCVSIACEDDAGTLVGVVHDPCRGETFTALRGAGAELNGRPLRLESSTDLSTALLGTGFSYDPAERERQAAITARAFPTLRDIRRQGSAALDLAWVAAGRYDGFFETDLAPWDWAAGGFIAAEAGAELREIPPGPGGHFGLVATRRGLADAVLALIAS